MIFIHKRGVVVLNLEVDVLELDNKCTVKLTGEIDVYTAPRLIDSLLPLTKKKGNKILIDLEKVTYLDSTGLGVFISAYKSSKENDSAIKLVHVRDRVLRLFQVTGLDQIMDLKSEEI